MRLDCRKGQSVPLQTLFKSSHSQEAQGQVPRLARSSPEDEEADPDHALRKTDRRSWVRRPTAPFREAPLTHEIALVSRRLPLPQHDPVDRFLAATALVLDLTLVTADASLLRLGEIATLANR